MKNWPFFLVFIFFFCLKAKAQLTPITIGESRSLYSEILKENRKFNIYLPEGYNDKDTIRYPVIYLLDGGMDEDFLHVAGLVQFDSFDWIKRVPKSIVVGVVNVDRQRDFTFKPVKSYPTSGHSELFRAFLANELMPFIERTYLTKPIKTLIGESLGGLLAAEVLLKKPNLFTHYVIISPSLWWDHGSLLKQNAISYQGRVYIGVGKEGRTPGNPPRIMEKDAKSLAAKLKAKGINIKFDYLPQETHATIGHPAVFSAFRWLYQ